MPDWTKEQENAIYYKHEDYKNMIVSAGAGSGKTAVLTERVIQMIKRGVNISNLLILTFTNDAAHELKNRIREAISSDKSLIDQLDYLDSSYISTFDAFSLSIVKKYSYLLNVGQNIDVADEAIIYLEKKRIINDIFDRLYEEKNPNFLKMINDLTKKNDEDIKKNIIKISDSLDLKYDKKEYLEKYIGEYYSCDKINVLFDDYTNMLIEMIDEIKDLFQELEGNVTLDYYSNLDVILEPLFLSNDYESIRRNINVDIKSLTKKDTLTDEASDIKTSITKIISDIKKLVVYDKKYLIDSVMSTKDYVSIIIDIILELDQRLNSIKKEMNMYDFSDISKMGIKILKDEKNSDIREELKNYFYEIIIDEYQDTSDLQEDFISLIANNNVYVVGDIKQSIYKFRNANPNLFKTKYNDYLDRSKGFKIDLTENFRSRDEVIKDINLIFSNIMTENIGDADYKKSHLMKSGNKDYLGIGKTSQNNHLEILNYYYDKTLNYSKEEIEIFYIAQDIKEKVKNKYQVFDKKKKKLRDVNYGDFTIILDRKSPFDLYKKIFQYFQIPLTINTPSNIVLENEISLIKNIIKLLIDHKNNNHGVEFDYAFTSVARSYLFEMTDEEIFKIIKTKKYDSELLNIIDSISSSIEYLSLNEILSDIINKFKFYQKFILVGDINSRINRITSIIKIFDNLSNINYSVYDAYDYLNEIIEDKRKIEVETQSVVENSVKIINAHKSKGLEYPICYYASLHHEFNRMDLNDRILYSKKYEIITPYFNEGLGTTFIKELYKKDYVLEDISERIRLFYVALTRAREKMIIVTSFPEKETTSIKKCKSILDFLNYSKRTVFSYIKSFDVNDLELTKEYKNVKKKKNEEINIESQNILKIEEFDIPNELVSKEKISKETHDIINKEIKKNMEFGTKIHEVLELLDFNNPELDDLDIDKKYKNNILNLISKLDINNSINTYKEYEFLYEENNSIRHGIVDLIVEYKDLIKIIDYKSKNIDDDAYVKQLDSYKNYVSLKTNKKIEKYLFSIADGILKEV